MNEPLLPPIPLAMFRELQMAIARAAVDRLIEEEAENSKASAKETI